MYSNSQEARQWGAYELLNVSRETVADTAPDFEDSFDSLSWPYDLVDQMLQEDELLKYALRDLTDVFDFCEVDKKYFKAGFASAHLLLAKEAENKKSYLQPLTYKTIYEYVGRVRALEEEDIYEEYSNRVYSNLEEKNESFVDELYERLQQSGNYGEEEEWAYLTGVLCVYDLIHRQTDADQMKLPQEILKEHRASVYDRRVTPEDFVKYLPDSSASDN